MDNQKLGYNGNRLPDELSLQENERKIKIRNNFIYYSEVVPVFSGDIYCQIGER
jgi:hypothetical protein